MRTLTANQTRVFNNPTGWAVYSRFSAKKAGVWIDLTNLAGYDWVQSWSFRQTVDDQAASLSVEISREVYNLSLAPLKGNSRFNTGSPTITANSEVKMEVACMPPGTDPQASDWVLFFHGYVDSIDSGPDPIRVECRDLAAKLQKKFIKKQRPYSSSAGVAVETQMQSILDDNMAGETYTVAGPYKVGDCVRYVVSGTTYGFICTVAGTAGASAPAWNTTTGATTIDGGVTWQCTGPGVTLVVPTSPLWVIKGPWFQDKKPVMDALADLAGQTGWALRYIYNAAQADFALTFYEPYRAKTTPDYTIASNVYHEVKQLKTDSTGVRNYIRVIYGDLGSPDNLGNPTRIGVVALDAASIAKYDENYMEVTESATSRISDSAQATALASAILSDLKDPFAEHQISMDFFWPVEIHDLWKFSANGVHYDADQKYSVIGIEHSVSATEAITTVLTRGTSVANYLNWLERGARPGVALQAPFAGPQAVTAVSVLTKIGGASIGFAPPTVNKSPDYASSELHLSTTNGFTPSSSTLKEQGGLANRFEVGDLVPGTTYYGQVIAKDTKGNQSTTSGQFSFVAGYSRPMDQQPLIDWLTLPPNGNFEATNAGTADNWTGGSGMTVVSGGFSGTNCLRVPASSSAPLKSGIFPVKGGAKLLVKAWLKSVGPGTCSACAVNVALFSDAGLTTVESATMSAATVTNSWTEFNYTIGALASAVFAQVQIVGSLAGGLDCLVDKVQVLDLGDDFTDATLLNAWTNFGGGSPNLAYRLDDQGNVHLRGAITSGANGTKVCTLPSSAYWPKGNVVFNVATRSPSGTGTWGTSQFYVDTGGNVWHLAGGAATSEYHLDSIYWRTSY